MPRLVQRVPAYRLHKVSGQAIVTLSGFDHYLGAYGSEESRHHYDRLIAEWLSAGRHFAKPTAEPIEARLTIDEVVLAFWRHAETYYVSPITGEPTSELDHFRQAIRRLRRLYGSTPAEEFGPNKLAAVRETMIPTWSRKHINQQVRRLVMVFKYAASKELVPASVHLQLKTLPALKRGRTAAREMPRKKPVPQSLVDGVKPFVSRQVWAMIQVQLLSGCRPGEIVKLRPCDIDQATQPWKVVLEEHKTEHHGKVKTIYFGPRAQAVLSPFLQGRDNNVFLFSAIEAEQERRANQHAARKTPLNTGNRPGTNRKASRTRPIAEAYSEASYRRAIARACESAFPPPAELTRAFAPGRRKVLETRAAWEKRLGPAEWNRLLEWEDKHHWHPHQLRHNAATAVRAEFGLEMARVILGNSSVPMAELYAEVNNAKAEQIIAQIG